MSKQSPDTQSILQCLQSTATETLDRKRRLGQYAVIWENGRIKKLLPSIEPNATALNEEKSPYNEPNNQ